MPTKQTVLANAHATWHATADKQAAKMALKNVLVAADYVASTDRITIRLDGTTTIEILVDADDFIEVITLDAYGNIVRAED